MTTPKIDNEPILIRDVQDGICLLTLNRPKFLNAMSTEMLTELQNAFYEIGDDVAIKVVILKGNGSIFCSGHDLKEMRSDPSFDTIHDLFLLCSRMMVTMNNLPQPIIGQAHGIATAAGCQLLVNCDLAFASEEARFATPGVTNGLFCSTPAVAPARSSSPLPRSAEPGSSCGAASSIATRGDGRHARMDSLRRAERSSSASCASA